MNASRAVILIERPNGSGRRWQGACDGAVKSPLLGTIDYSMLY
jgi:hypothetical protein